MFLFANDALISDDRTVTPISNVDSHILSNLKKKKMFSLIEERTYKIFELLFLVIQ